MDIVSSPIQGEQAHQASKDGVKSMSLEISSITTPVSRWSLDLLESIESPAVGVCAELESYAWVVQMFDCKSSHVGVNHVRWGGKQFTPMQDCVNSRVLKDVRPGLYATGEVVVK